MVLPEPAPIAALGLLLVTLLLTASWWRSSPGSPPSWQLGALTAGAVVATLALWGHEELATRCLGQDNDLRACVAAVQRAYPHRAQRTRPALTRIVEQTCRGGEPFAHLDWLADHIAHLDHGERDDLPNHSALASDLLRETCRAHASCCTALLREANAHSGWSPTFQTELSRWNNTLPWQTW